MWLNVRWSWCGVNIDFHISIRLMPLEVKSLRAWTACVWRWHQHWGKLNEICLWLKKTMSLLYQVTKYQSHWIYRAIVFGGCGECIPAGLDLTATWRGRPNETCNAKGNKRRTQWARIWTNISTLFNDIGINHKYQICKYIYTYYIHHTLIYIYILYCLFTTSVG